MSESTCNGMTENEFRALAKKAVVDYWNGHDILVLTYGKIDHSDVYVTWQCKAIENFKALLGVDRNGDGLYFEFTLHAAKNQCYLDVYEKKSQVVVAI
jgi:hypothetical protein